ncbi:MAG: alpha/beta hydrolase-fold protein [Gemmatimonadales bacterium]|nr:alpha/beta hydrolase-fold protein [Gemmatimonadales bacterium]
MPATLQAIGLALMLLARPLGGQHPPVVLAGTEQRTLSSDVNSVSYKLYVALPAGYDTSAVRYPVVYLLDADYSFAIARNIVQHLSERGHLPPAIIVGIAYDGPPQYRRHRTRDYTPTHVPSGGYGAEVQAVSGGGPRFRRFIADELIPFIEREYRSSAMRVLVGHSYGGLFAAWVALHDPRLFGGYVIVSPSLWYDDHLLFSAERRLAAASGDLPARLYLAVGSREINGQRNMVADLRRFATVLERRNHPGLRLRWSVEDGETHNSVFPGALSDGLRFVLGGR